MRFLWLLLATGLFAADPGLQNVKSVYLLPMANGMDQYLANHLQSSGVYIVTADPLAADAVFTDALGPAFEKKLAELYPPPPKEDEEEDTERKEERMSAFRRGRGMIFLVDRRSKHVVWSTYEMPKDYRADQLDRSAKRVTDRLRQSLVPKASK